MLPSGRAIVRITGHVGGVDLRHLQVLGAGECRVCGCTDYDCHACIERTGEPCTWIAPDLCSACGEAG